MQATVRDNNILLPKKKKKIMFRSTFQPRIDDVEFSPQATHRSSIDRKFFF